jgi:hypothetical protein
MQPHLEDLREPSVGRQKPEFPLKPKLEMSALQKWNPFRGSSLWVPKREVEKILNRMASVLGRNHRMFRPLLVMAFTLQLAGASAAADSVSDFATGRRFDPGAKAMFEALSQAESIWAVYGPGNRRIKLGDSGWELSICTNVRDGSFSQVTNLRSAMPCATC